MLISHATPMPTTTSPILVCDDEMHIRAMISAKLRTSGFEVAEARNGQEGLEKASQTLPRLIITDFQMPLMSGIEMATQLRNSASTSSIPIIMLTARGYILTPEQVAATCIREVLPKPFGVRQLLLKVHEILADPSRRVATPEDDAEPLAA